MHVRDGFSGVLAVVDDEAETFAAILDAEFVGDLSRSQQQRAEGGLILSHRLADTWDELFRHDEDMDGCLRGDVVESDHQVVFIDERCWDLVVYDFLEDGFVGHDENKKSEFESLLQNPEFIQICDGWLT